VPARRVEHQLGDGERADAIRSLENQPPLLLFDLVETADAGADDGAAHVGIVFREVDPRVLHGVGAGDQCELGEAVDPLYFLRLDVACGGPVVDVAAELHLVVGRVEELDRVNAAFTSKHALPQIPDFEAQGGDGANASYDNSSFHRSTSTSCKRARRGGGQIARPS
jgi:hypothetical protein